MTKLTTEQTLYLLYSYAYAESSTVTKGTVKPHLPSKWQAQADKIYVFLETQELVLRSDKQGKPTKREGRFSVTKQGKAALVKSLASTGYEFDSPKGYRVLNALLACIKDAVSIPTEFNSPAPMAFDDLQQKFKALYSEERKRQELGGVVAIHKKELFEKFQHDYKTSLTSETLEEYFNQLKSDGQLFTSKGERDDLVHWVE
jgi:hypothetical protein